MNENMKYVRSNFQVVIIIIYFWHIFKHVDIYQLLITLEQFSSFSNLRLFKILPKIADLLHITVHCYICYISAIYLLYICYVSAIYLLYICYVSATYLLYICYIFAIYLLYICYISAIYLLYICYIFAIYLLYTCYISATYLLYIC